MVTNSQRPGARRHLAAIDDVRRQLFATHPPFCVCTVCPQHRERSA